MKCSCWLFARRVSKCDNLVLGREPLMACCQLIACEEYVVIASFMVRRYGLIKRKPAMLGCLVLGE
jgi:hypothetical protein